MKTFDVLYHWNEPPSFGALAMADAQFHGVVVNSLPMGPTSPRQAFAALQQSKSDAVLFVSPAQYADFFRQVPDLRCLGKPLVSFATEWCYGNPMSAYRAFQESGHFFHAYACGQQCDVDATLASQRHAFLSPLWVSTMSFRPGPLLSGRIPKMVFIGDLTEYAQGVYSTRRRLLAALQKRNLVDVIDVPKGVLTSHLVASIYSQYAAVFCPASNGRAQSIRVYEAAASGALVIEAQPMEKQNEYFVDGVHRIALDPEIGDEDLCRFVQDLDYSAHQHIADAARLLAHEAFAPAASISRLMAMADTAPTA